MKAKEEIIFDGDLEAKEAKSKQAGWQEQDHGQARSSGRSGLPSIWHL